MIASQVRTMIDFRPVAVGDKALYNRFLTDGNLRGCESSFANVFLWGQQNIAVLDNHLLLFSCFGKRCVYPYPLGHGDKKTVLDAIIGDAHARGISCRITTMTEEAADTLRTLYPGKFRFYADEGAFDYVYSIDDLAELKGKKYHGKRNHIHRFREQFPDYTVTELNDDTLPVVRRMTDTWFAARQEEDPAGEYHKEKAALDKAFLHYRELQMDCLALMNGEEVLAVTMGSHLSDDTVDVHFEKARSDIQGAYTAINWEFARYIRNKYPSVRYLDREEDMGIEGLRKAKQSYHPHHMIYKCWAQLAEDGHDD